MVTPKKKLMIEALKRQLGIVSLACKEVDIARKTHYAWLKADEAYKKEVEEIDDYCIDFVENALLKKINTGDTASILFYLKCRAKKRGYVERPENQYNFMRQDNLQINQEISVKDLIEEALSKSWSKKNLLKEQ